MSFAMKMGVEWPVLVHYLVTALVAVMVSNRLLKRYGAELQPNALDIQAGRAGVSTSD